MKFLILIFLLGLAAASAFQDVSERKRHKTPSEFVQGMKMASPLRVDTGMPQVAELNEREDEIKTELGKALRATSEKIKEGEEVDEKLMDKIEKAELEFFEDRTRKAKIGSREKLHNRNDKGVRSLKDSWDKLKQKVKDIFKDKHMDLNEKYSAFYEWLLDMVKKGLEIAKDRTEAVRNIARVFLRYAKEVSKEIAIEALGVLKPYKDVLGDIWIELEIEVKEVLERQD